MAASGASMRQKTSPKVKATVCLRTPLRTHNLRFYRLFILKPLIGVLGNLQKRRFWVLRAPEI